MNHKRIVDTLNPLHVGLANHVSTSPIGDSEKTPPIFYDAVKLEEKLKFAHNFEWYKLLSANNYSIKELKKCNMLDKLIEFGDSYTEESQFPPDFVKCARLHKLLQLFEPSHILELGSGTSTLVISNYLKDKNKETSGESIQSLTVERSSDWLHLTINKIKSVIGDYPVNHKYYSHNTDEETIDTLEKFSESSKTLYIYLDSVVLDEEKHQGLDLVEKIISNVTGKVVIHIDVRTTAIQELGPMLNRHNLQGTRYTNFIKPIYTKDIRGDVQLVKRAFARFYWPSMTYYTVAVIDTVN